MTALQKFILFGLFSVVATISLFTATYYFFTIKTLICYVGEVSCPDDIQNKIQYLKGKSLFFTDIETEVAKILTEQSYTVVRLEKQLPSTVIFSLSGAHQQYQISLGDNQWVIYNSSAESTITAEPAAIPSISVDLSQNPQLATTYNPQIAELIGSLSEQKISYNEILQPSEEYVELKLADGYTVFIPLDEARLKTMQLRIILDSFETDLADQKISVIDLRFTHPVLR